MGKSTAMFECSSCGHKQSIMTGVCPTCKEFDTFEKVDSGIGGGSKSTHNHKRIATNAPSYQSLTDVKPGDFTRTSTGNTEFDRVLGGGIVYGSIVAIGGQAGAGKSTLLTQVSGYVAKNSGKVVYMSGEESPSQIQNRAERIGAMHKNVYLVSDTSVNNLLNKHIPEIGTPSLLIVDSVNMVSDDENSSAPGGHSQVRSVASLLQEYAKKTGVPVILVVQITKSGDISGPEFLRHLVDTVLYLEGDQYGVFRLLRSLKNRFGATGEVGVFSMEERGMVSVPNPSERFLAERLEGQPGSSVTSVVEGQRAILLEVQAITRKTENVNPKRRAQGFDRDRVDGLMTVISEYFKDKSNGKPFAVDLDDVDVLVNVVGGLKVGREADLAVVTSVLSSYVGKPVPPDVAVIGEVGYTGEIRTVPQIEMRVKEAIAQGFSKVITSRLNTKVKGAKVIEVKTLADVANAIF